MVQEAACPVWPQGEILPQGWRLRLPAHQLGGIWLEAHLDARAVARRLVHSQLELPEHFRWDVSWSGQLDTTESAASALILHLARIELATFCV